MSSTDTQIQITLLANGIHALERGFETFNDALPREITDSWPNNSSLLLKEAIMFIHQGVELLLKQILAQQSEYLIFSDIQKAAYSALEARQAGKSVFELKRPPHTVSFDEALLRVRAFVAPAELDESLARRLTDLNTLRNSVEHYALQADRNSTVRLLAEIRPSLLRLFEACISRFPEEAASLMTKANQTKYLAEHLLRVLH